MTRRAMVLAGLAVAIAAGCGGSAQQGRVAEEESTGDTAPPADSGGDGMVTTTTSAGGEAPAPPPSEPTPMVAASEEWNALLEADADLDASLELAQPDCGAAADHLERLCELAERICEIAEDTGDQGAQDRCTDGTVRCERGRTAHADTCD